MKDIVKFLVNIKGYNCSRCSHKWISKLIKKLPARCPKCKSPYWHKKRKNIKKPVISILDKSI